MIITPFISSLISSCSSQGYFVTVSRDLIRIKINDSEFVFITRDNINGFLCFFVSRNGSLNQISSDFVYDFLFACDEYGLRLYGESVGCLI